MRDAFGVSKGIRMPNMKTIGMSQMDKTRYLKGSPGKPYIMPSKKVRLKRILRGKP